MFVVDFISGFVLDDALKLINEKISAATNSAIAEREQLARSSEDTAGALAALKSLPKKELDALREQIKSKKMSLQEGNDYTTGRHGHFGGRSRGPRNHYNDMSVDPMARKTKSRYRGNMGEASRRK